MIFPVTFHEADIDAVAAELAREVQGGDVVLLSGELGAGKTTLTKALVKALGATAHVTSPTFTIMNVYSVPSHSTIIQVVHVDTYRMERPEEFDEMGLAEYLGRPDTFCIIEWPEKIEQHITRGRVWRLHLSGTGDLRTLANSTNLA